MIKRRRFVIGLGALAASLPASAQQKVHRIGMLTFQTGATAAHDFDTFVQSLRQLGYIEGKNILIERRFAGGNVDRLPALATELIEKKVDIIVAATTPATRASKQVAGAIPIVFVNVADPIGSGFVESLARPGGMLTGLANLTPALTAKRLELLKEAVPKISRIAAIGILRADNPQLPEALQGSKALGLEIFPTVLQRRDDLETVSEQLRKWRFDSMLIFETPSNRNNRALLAEFASKHRIPAVGPTREYAEAGALISYGATVEAMYRRAATYVDKILKGASPRDLPVELPTTFELVVNLKTAKTLGLTIPQSILARANRVIE